MYIFDKQVVDKVLREVLLLSCNHQQRSEIMSFRLCPGALIKLSMIIDGDGDNW